MNNSTTVKEESISDVFDQVISPHEEMLAFESLWAKEDMSDKKFTELGETNLLPSQIVERNGVFFPEGLREAVQDYLGQLSNQFSVAIWGDFQYPDKLQDAIHPIGLFYYQGDINLVNTRCLSVVGSRQCSQAGKNRTKKLVKLLVEHNFTIISGLAKGVDTVALETAIEEGGRVIGVIGTPINQYYPAENKTLQDKIASEHLLISQVPFYRYNHLPFNDRRFYFPKRNATMSALSLGTIIVEAGETSGTLTQARAALQQQRQLFILQSCFDNSAITWPKHFEKKGAIRVRAIEDIISNLKE